MTDKNDLKIEFRAVPYTDNYHALQYRISPDQDLEYVKEVSWLWGLIKFKYKTTYSTKWRSFELFHNHCSSYLYNVDDIFNWMPILIKGQQELNFYKHEYRTWGQWTRWVDQRHKREMKNYKVEREKYLKRKSTTFY